MAVSAQPLSEVETFRKRLAALREKRLDGRIDEAQFRIESARLLSRIEQLAKPKQRTALT